MAAGRAVGAPDADPPLRELAENGRKEFAWRLVEGQPRLVVVVIGFTIAGLEHELYDRFEQRMLRFAQTLGKLGHPVIGLVLQRRRAQGKRHWAEFVCATPEARLPVPVRGG